MARQYNLKNLNGIHLKAPYDYTSYSTNGVVNALIEDYDFHPYRSNDLSDFEFINGSYNLVDKTSIYDNMPMGNGFIGDNSKATRNIAVDYTQFKKNNMLVKGEVYYTSFDMYFNFNGDGQNYEVSTTGYTINVDIYAIFGNNKKKLRLSDLKVYDYASATCTTTGDTINVSYLPHPHVYVIENTSASNITFQWIEGDVGQPFYGTSVFSTVSPTGNLYITSFTLPVVTPFDVGPEPEYDIQDRGLAEEPNISPFNVMSGYMFKVTAELDTSTEELFNSNICTGNKDFKIMVDYNGRISQTTVGYLYDDIEVDNNPPPLPA
jgi:hypothetical protein